MMRCKHCGNECVKGRVEIKYAKSLSNSFTLNTFYQDKEAPIDLELTSTEAYYCDMCMKVTVEFKQT